MNDLSAALIRSERGVERGADAVWAAAQRRHRRSRLPVAAAMVAFVAIAVAALVVLRYATHGEPDPIASLPPTNTEASLTPETSDLIGSEAPDMRGTTTDGTDIALSSFGGSWVVLDWYSSWCVPCQPAQAELIVRAALRPDVKIVTIIFDDDLEQATARLQAEGVTWPIVDVDDEVHLGYAITAVPTVVLIGPDGLIRDASNGATTIQGLFDEIPSR